ncbi:MAG: hypothetical protein AABZ14_02780, partial [Candidatus Margulisiibacteriota bacterium]
FAKQVINGLFIGGDSVSGNFLAIAGLLDHIAQTHFQIPKSTPRIEAGASRVLFSVDKKVKELDRLHPAIIPPSREANVASLAHGEIIDQVLGWQNRASGLNPVYHSHYGNRISTKGAMMNICENLARRGGHSARYGDESIRAGKDGYLYINTPDRQQRIFFDPNGGTADLIMQHAREQNIKVDLIISGVSGHAAGDIGDIKKLLSAGFGKYAILTTNSTVADITLIPGVNHDSFDPKRHSIVSSSSCGTNGFVLATKPFEYIFGKDSIQSVSVTMMHGITNTQQLGNGGESAKDRRALGNLGFTKTGLSDALGLFFPDVKAGAAVSSRGPWEDISLL